MRSSLGVGFDTTSFLSLVSPLCRHGVPIDCSQEGPQIGRVVCWFGVVQAFTDHILSNRQHR